MCARCPGVKRLSLPSVPPWSLTPLSGSIPSVVESSILGEASLLVVDSSVKEARIAGQIRVPTRLDRLHDYAPIVCTVPLCCSRARLRQASAHAMLVCKC